VTITRDQIAKILAESLSRRGQRVEGWTEDERTLFRTGNFSSFDERYEAVTALRLQKAADAVIAAMTTEWGVRYPNGSVDIQETEADARRWAICYTGLRPDLPVLVMRKAVGGWETVTETTTTTPEMVTQ
jgi:hypothetical protein